MAESRESMKSIRIGTGAGYGGDRIDAAVDLVKHGDLDYLVLEGLAERTTALAHLEKAIDREKGYGQFLEERMAALLSLCQDKGVTVITNLGAANPESAAKKTAEIASSLGLSKLRVATVIGADVLEQAKQADPPLWETGAPLSTFGDDVISADAYLGVDAILPALVQGADVILTGRVADPSLFLAPMVYEFGWELSDWHLLGAGTVLAHLLECGAQVSGGYFADGCNKRVPELHRLGMPFADVFADGTGIISKTPGSGGTVTLQTCKEQLLYEVMDPTAYMTPDVTADFSSVWFKEVADNRIAVNGGNGRERPAQLKATIGVNQGYIGEGMIAYGGYGAAERARLAAEIVLARLTSAGFNQQEVKHELLGVNGLFQNEPSARPYEVLLRVAARAKDRRQAERVGEEVEALWLNGPGGPGGVRSQAKRVVSAYSASIPRTMVKTKVFVTEVIA